MASGSSSTPTSSSITKASKDIGWDYGTPDPRSRDAVKCNFCQKVSNGGITRLKHHLLGTSTNVTKCKNCPTHVKERLQEQLQKKMDAKEAMNQVRNCDAIVEEDCEDVEMENVPRGVPGTKGPMDMFFRRENVTKKRKGGKEEVDQEKYRKELRDHAVQMFSRWMYDAGIAFNAANYDSLQAAVEAIGQYGPGMKAPTYHEVRVTCLKKERTHTEKLVEENMLEGKKNGCTLMADGWTDRNGRVLINFLVNTPKGSVFLDTVDASSYSKTGTRMCELLSKYIEQIGPENVVQVVTDNASENVKAGKLLEATYPHLFWTPCAAHCLDLMFEDIFKIERFKKTIERAIRVNGYIYSRSRLLNMMRSFTNNKEMVRPAKTRFATGFLTLKRFQEEKRNLVKLFNSDEWHGSKFSKENVGRKIRQILLMPSFWRYTCDVLKVGGPLLTVLRMVDGEQKPAMGYIYEAMDKAKEAIAKAFSNNEDKYKDIFKIVDKRWDSQLHRPLHAAGYYLNPGLFYNNPEVDADFEIVDGFQTCLLKMVSSVDVQGKITEELHAYRYAEGSFGKAFAIRYRATMPPAEWWVNYGASAPNLRKFAIRILSLVCSSSGCERNWSFFEHIHSKKRNRLAQRRLNDLVYIKYNRALKRRHQLRGKIDPIALTDIDETNEWLTGEPENDIIDMIDDDEDDGLAGVDVGAHEMNESEYNFRSENPSSSVPPSNRRTLVNEDSEEENTPLWDINEESVANDDDTFDDDDNFDDDI